MEIKTLNQISHVISSSIIFIQGKLKMEKNTLQHTQSNF